MRKTRESGKHDRLARRLGLILTRLNTGEKLYPDDLCREFAVSGKTIQRDFNERLSYLPIERGNGFYYLDPKYLGSTGSHSISLLLSNMGIKSLFSDRDYLAAGILNSGTNPPFLFRNPSMEDITGFVPEFETLTEAIRLRYIIAFTYDGQRYTEMHPYRLVNDEGIWYLAAAVSGQLHQFRVANITELTYCEQVYKPDPNIAARV